MKAVGIRELKNSLSEYLRQVRGGEEVLVTDRGKPVAELRAPSRSDLTEEQWQELKALAAERRISVVELIRQAVEDLLPEGSTLGRAEMKRRALAATGRYRSGERDLSTRHDDHLAEIFGE
ncbi:MAG: type II toxin-antitoxin system prevent-host-death family antitoxin [Acidobacteria bacterium]|nr:type II toxin-antitoxin system prevent-host-death family antitoxin [Acidobacteriota bacterium]